SRMHVFPYSPRAGTIAAKMTDQVPEHIKKERVHRMQELAARKAHDFHRSFLGQTAKVLFETNTAGITDGLTDNYIRVYTDSTVQTGEIYDVYLEKPYKDGLWGSLQNS
ncbi:MAG TPA: tRNA (N(6)-L-threonylcarbamoyladenosine(37)-C(2))-methylthiotransferase MtaB, partial [Selenomonas sp.]|nr:tRNA (N(6)-L-threonylcarbamoyladenosine(37)-C(2))-methylthiotransferase MtaB [Selenomonas sp.]